jgi:hypothetical protein
VPSPHRLARLVFDHPQTQDLVRPGQANPVGTGLPIHDLTLSGRPDLNRRPPRLSRAEILTVSGGLCSEASPSQPTVSYASGSGQRPNSAGARSSC